MIHSVAGLGRARRPTRKRLACALATQALLRLRMQRLACTRTAPWHQFPAATVTSRGAIGNAMHDSVRALCLSCRHVCMMTGIRTVFA